LNREDSQFWHGFLKGVMASEFEAWQIEPQNEDQWRSKKKIMEALDLLERRVKLLESEDVLSFLSQYVPDKDMKLSWGDSSDHKKQMKMRVSISEEHEL